MTYFKLLFIISNGSLLDIGKKMEELSGLERALYHDQLSTRECRISEEVDFKFQVISMIQLNSNLMILQTCICFQLG